MYENLLNEAPVLFPEQFGLDHGIVLNILSFMYLLLIRHIIWDETKKWFCKAMKSKRHQWMILLKTIIIHVYACYNIFYKLFIDWCRGSLLVCWQWSNIIFCNLLMRWRQALNWRSHHLFISLVWKGLTWSIRHICWSPSANNFVMRTRIPICKLFSGPRLYA